MIPGFNHNITHNGTVYHVQTEDSGIKKAQITTHIYIGGNVIASEKQTYTELALEVDIADQVKTLMQEQHKVMLKNLVRGEYDDVQTRNVRHLDGPAPLNTTPRSTAPQKQVAAPAAPCTNEVDPGRVIFGEDLISERSLDEVILDYLADDLNKQA